MSAAGRRSTTSARVWDGTKADLAALGKEEGFAPATLLGDTADALAGYIRCPRCGGSPVPVEFGNLAGRPLRDWIADAEKTVRYQKCKGGHAPVLVGAAGPAVAGEDEWCATHDNWASYCPCGTQASSQPPAVSGEEGQAATEGEGTGGRTEPPAPASSRAAENGHEVTATAVFQEPLGQRREEHPVPAAAGKKARAKGAPCPHRIQPGSYCKRCERTVP